MRLGNKKRLTLVIGFLLSLGLACGCDETRGSAATTTPTTNSGIGKPLKVVIAVDVSASVCPRQLEIGLENVRKLLPGIGPGWTVLVIQVSDVTGFSAPLFAETFPPPSKGMVRTISTKTEKLRRELTARLDSSVAAAFAPPSRSIQSTDLFAVFDKYKRDPEGRETRIIIASDGLHVDGLANLSPTVRPVNMEKIDFTTLAVPAFVQKLMTRYKWSPTTLRGTGVYFLLPDAAACSVPNLGTTKDLGNFYRALIGGALGGELRWFDHYLTGGEL